MAERPPHGWDEIPEGCEVVAVPDPAWRLQGGMSCRYTTGPGRRTCREPTIAELNRAFAVHRLQCGHSTPRPNWWAYCEDHLYGRWIENGKVMHWILRQVSDA